MRPSTLCLRCSKAHKDHVLKQLALIRQLNPSINAFTSFWRDDQAAIQELESLPEGPLSGITVGVKDIFCTKQFPTTCGSRMLKDYISPFDATVVEALRASGAFIIGKTNMDEFGMGSTNVYSSFGPTFCPTYPISTNEAEKYSNHVAGGSSGGSAAAVAAGMCDVSLASDTGGSTRLPASYCGVVGFKPSYGIISRWGMVAYASSLDCVGIMGKTVKEVKQVFDVLAFRDNKDPSAKPEEATERMLKNWDISTMTIGVPQQYFPEDLCDNIRMQISTQLKFLKDTYGVKIKSVSLPHAAQGLSAYYVLASAEASSNLARYDGAHYGFRAESPGEPRHVTSRTLGFGEEVKRRLLLGTYALTAEAYDNYVLKAQKIREIVSRELKETLGKEVDVLVAPSTMKSGKLFREELESRKNDDTAEIYGQDLVTVGASLAGIAAASVPMGKEGGGMQIIGDEGAVFTVGARINRLTKD